MINALSPTLIARIFSLVVVSVTAGALLLTSGSASSVWKVQGAVVGVVNALVFLLTLRPVFLWLYRLTRAELWWFPLLDGKWTGEVRSNWPRVKAQMEAAARGGPVFNALTDELPEGDDDVTPLEANITSSLFAIEMVLVANKRRSRTIFVRPRWCRPAPPEITYVYEQADHHGRVAVTDELSHNGAAMLNYDIETGELRGEYWTNRAGTKGLNTAGVIVLRRC